MCVFRRCFVTAENLQITHSHLLPTFKWLYFFEQLWTLSEWISAFHLSSKFFVHTLHWYITFEFSSNYTIWDSWRWSFYFCKDKGVPGLLSSDGRFLTSTAYKASGNSGIPFVLANSDSVSVSSPYDKKCAVYLPKLIVARLSSTSVIGLVGDSDVASSAQTFFCWPYWFCMILSLSFQI